MESYFELGFAAHDAGKLRAPALDSRVMAELTGMPVGTGAVEIMQSWLDGWDYAHTQYMKQEQPTPDCRTKNA